MRRNTAHAGGNKGAGKNGLKFKGRFSSAASLQSALNLKRKEAFDNESHMMETTEDENVTFVTSTTDYLRSKDDKSRDLDGSFDALSDNSGSRGKDPTANHSIFASRSQGPGTANAREQKRLQEREWERDRQRRATAEPRVRPKPTRRSYESTTFHKLNTVTPIEIVDVDDESDNVNIYEQSHLQPRSSRQLGSTPKVHHLMARDGYDSDSYSMKASRRKMKAGRNNAPTPNRKHSEVGPIHSGSHRYDPIRSLLEESTTNLDESLTFVPSSTLGDTKADANSAGDSYMQESTGKIKMTKMEKIKQLQGKNDRYKEEYKKTYLEKKEFKKKYEDKKMEVASLTSEVESYMKETALLKKQLHQLTSEMDHTGGSARKDAAKVAQLQKDLQQVRADLKQALGRIADRKMESGQLQEVLKRKDEQIESLTLEVSRQIEEVQRLQAQISIQDMQSLTGDQAGGHGAADKETQEQLDKLAEENESMKAELSMTLTRAAEMVKNREGTIEILRKENHELKELMDIRDQDDDRTTASEKIRSREETIEQLRTELAGLKETLNSTTDEKEGLKEVIRNREAELKNIKIDVEGLKKMVKRAEKDANKAKKEVDERDVSIATLKEEVRDTKSQSKDTARKIQELNKAVESRDEEIKQLQDRVKLLKENQDGSCEKLGKARSSLQNKDHELKSLFRENEDLKAELLQQRETLDQKRKQVHLELEATRLREKELHDQVEATDAMVKNRDDAIEDLLKEVERLKQYRDEKESSHTEAIKEREQSIADLRKDTDGLKARLHEKGEELEHTREMVKEREVAIEDLLRDIESLKRDGNDLEKRVNSRTAKLNQQIKSKTSEVEKLQAEVEDLTNRLNDAQRSLESKSDNLQEREEEIEELLKDVGELKRQHKEQISAKKEGDQQSVAHKEELQRELDMARERIKENEEKLRRIVKENVDLKDELEAANAAKEQLEQDKPDDASEEEEETKSFLLAQHEVLEEEIQQLNDQVNELQEELEEVHRQNSILNEEVEDWLQRGGNFELEIQRLRNEIEGWEDKAEQLKAAAEKGDTNLIAGVDTGDQHAMLEKAMAERQRKADGNGKGVWGLFFNQSEEGEELTEEQKRIKELEAIKDAQAEELQKVKSDLVKLTTNSRNESYVSKKKIADLEEANEGYKAKVDLLLRRLAEVQGVPYGDFEDQDDEKKTEDPSSFDAPASLFRSGLNLLQS